MFRAIPFLSQDWERVLLVVIFIMGRFVCLFLVLNLLTDMEDLYVHWRLDFISSSERKVGIDLTITEDLPLRDRGL